ncbi:MAG: 16S rRNA (guanine(527)-N(7))-methyltransferase RsmG [Eubacteriales bacterium]|nr:16S rRNA (guanine(527)-N(7))-methyltransferase RsmG [Eubacteriales bacterium]
MTDDLGGWLDKIEPYLTEPFNPLQKTQLLTYARILREWNEKINLTAILDDEGIAVRHFQDSLTILPELRLLQMERNSLNAEHAPKPLILADVGTGAGFPGLVIKIICPEIEVILIDALAKRLKFLDAVITELNLQGVYTIHARAEDAGRKPELREQCDIAVARAVANLPVLAEYCLPLVRRGGTFLAMKAQAEDEINESKKAIAVLGGETPTVRQFLLPGTDMNRTIIAIRKGKQTPPAYPRKAGKVEQTPLK